MYTSSNSNGGGGRHLAEHDRFIYSNSLKIVNTFAVFVSRELQASAHIRGADVQFVTSPNLKAFQSCMTFQRPPFFFKFPQKVLKHLEHRAVSRCLFQTLQLTPDHSSQVIFSACVKGNLI